MKICLLTHTMPRYPTDSSAPFIGELAERLSQEHDVTVLTPFDQLFDDSKRSYKVITYKYIWPVRLHQSGYSRVLDDNKMTPKMYVMSILMSLFALMKLVRLSRREKFDVVTAHWVIPNGFIAFLASFLTGIPYTVTIPGSDVYLGSRKSYFRIAIWLACKKARAVISDSRHYLDKLRELGVHSPHMYVIRYGVNEDAFYPMPKDRELLKSLGIPSTAKVILCVGRFVEKKGFVYAIEAMSEVRKKHKDAVMVLVGDGEQKRTYERVISRLKLSCVIFAGTVPYAELPRYYSCADCFVMPSMKDSAGNIDASPVAMMDAMMCGAPVVATSYSADSDTVIDGVSGYIVPEKNSKDIAKSIIAILNTKNKKGVKLRVRKIAVNAFSTRVTAQKYGEIFLGAR